MTKTFYNDNNVLNMFHITLLSLIHVEYFIILCKLWADQYDSKITTT